MHFQHIATPVSYTHLDVYKRQVSACPGEIGVAIIINNTDTVKVNDKSVYPMTVSYTHLYIRNSQMVVCH